MIVKAIDGNSFSLKEELQTENRIKIGDIIIVNGGGKEEEYLILGFRTDPECRKCPTHKDCREKVEIWSQKKGEKGAGYFTLAALSVLTFRTKRSVSVKSQEEAIKALKSEE